MLEIRFDGQRFNTWTHVSLRESVDDLCASIQLGIALPPHADTPLALTANTIVQVWVDGILASSIRIGKIRRTVSATAHSIEIDARSLARELVDCQYSATLNGLSLEALINRICTTFNVPLKIAAATAVVPHFAMQCEVPANALLNAVRTANLLLYPTPDGGLILTAPTEDAAVAVLSYGQDFTQYEIADNYDLRYSEYVVKSFDYAAGNSIKGAVKDNEFTFFRPLHIVADKHGHSTGSCDRRAELERNRRMAKAHALNLTVPRSGHAGGLWSINTQVRIVIPQEGIDSVFLIGERTFSEGENGTVTHLQVLHRNAFIGEPRIKKKRSSGTKAKGVGK